MTLNKNEKGLTLIELLITIAVIAIVAAISIPVITNVIESSRTSSAASMQAQVDAFVDRYDEAGQLNYDPTTQTFTGSVDLNADGQFSTDEVIETFTVDAGQFAVTAANGVYTVAGGAGSTGGTQATLQTVASLSQSYGTNNGTFVFTGGDADAIRALGLATDTLVSFTGPAVDTITVYVSQVIDYSPNENTIEVVFNMDPGNYMSAWNGYMWNTFTVLSR
jgi:prepilin-type N-terminal cleavage/methylation domain-containing protein